MPARHGVLFDPDRFPFLEGRPPATARSTSASSPRSCRRHRLHVLEQLLVLDGERHLLPGA